MESTESTVLLTIEGDLKAAALDTDTTVAIAELLPKWAAACSSYPASELVVLSGDKTTLYDPSDTLTDLGLGYGSVLRLLTGEEAQDVLEVTTATVPSPAPPPAPEASPRHDPPSTPFAPQVPISPSPIEAAEEDPGEGWPAPTPPPASPRRRFGSLTNRQTRPTVAQPHQLLSPPRPKPQQDCSPAPPAAVGAQPPAPAQRESTASEGICAHDPVAAAVVPDLHPPQYPGPVYPADQPQPSAAQGEEAFLPPKVPAAQRMSKALKAMLSRKAQPTQQVGAFAKMAAPPKASERYRQARRATDRAHNLELLIRQAALPRCMVIGVVSPKGGAGKTTITALLGMLFAELRRDPVLALDANPDFGNLKDKLGMTDQSPHATDELHAWLTATPAATPADLVTRLGSGPHGLRYLPTPTGNLERMVLGADFNLYRDLIARLRDYEGIILVDCGTGLLDPPVRAALETVDQILLITDSSADTARIVVDAAQYLPLATPTWLVANKMPASGSMVDLAEVADGIPQLRGMTIVPEQRLTENVVIPQFVWSEAPSVWQEPLREIGARLANNWRTLR